MTPEQQRIAIAEACGWRGISPQLLVGYAPWRKEAYSDRVNACPVGDLDCFPFDPLPEYLSDLNAMHGAEDVIGPKWTTYCETLLAIVEPEPRSLEVCHYWNLLHATAAQRAEAFLKTIDKWTN